MTSTSGQTRFLERTICCKVKTILLKFNPFNKFLERTICCKVKTAIVNIGQFFEFLERTICCKVKTIAKKGKKHPTIFRKNNLL